MKKQTPIVLVAFGIILIGVTYLIFINIKQKRELIKKEKKILKIWDDKIAEYQFIINATYRDSDIMKDFFEKLNHCYEIMRKMLIQEKLTKNHKNELIEFILTDFTNTAGIKKEEVFDRLEIDEIENLFVGDNLETVEKLDKLLNPNFMTGRIDYQDFDMWEKREDMDFRPGDTTVFMIRLLKNYSQNKHQIELIPSKNLKVIEPYLGELRVIIPKNAVKGELEKVSFKTYDWVNRDTIVEDLYLTVN
jgi:hypothetical protein